MIQPQITLQSYLHSETFNLVRHLEVTCNDRYRFLDHWRTTFKRCSQSIASVRLLSPFKMSDFRTIAFVLHLEQVSGVPLMVRMLKKSSGPGSVSVINLVDPLSGCKVVESGDYIPSLYSWHIAKHEIKPEQIKSSLTSLRTCFMFSVAKKDTTSSSISIHKGYSFKISMNWRMKQRFWLVKDSGYSSIQHIFENRKYVLSNVIGNVNVRVIWMHLKSWKLNDK